MKNAISRMLTAIKVECMDEFDRNFDTESFFGRAWYRRKIPNNARYKTLHGPQATLRCSLVASVAGGGMGRKKNGQLRQTQKNRQLSTEADFWKAMLMYSCCKSASKADGEAFDMDFELFCDSLEPSAINEFNASINGGEEEKKRQ